MAEEPTSWSCSYDWRTEEEIVTYTYPCGVSIEIREDYRAAWERCR